MTTKATSPAELYLTKQQELDALAVSMGDVQSVAVIAAENREAAEDALEHARGDFAIGRATKDALAAAEKRRDDAVAEHQRASAVARHAEEDFITLSREVERLAVEAREDRRKTLDQRHRLLVAKLRDQLTAAAETSRALGANFADAVAAFPESDDMYSKAAGLPALQWGEFEHIADAQYGGRLGGWFVAADAFLEVQ